jgi:alpha-amylase/alpha-mannosidase (GH57 family)
MNKYICVHGHFYQPPRENPWINEIENQESACPFKNWNERISAECYYPNANARILNGGRQVKKIVNNYEKMSFNFGPTLLSWLEDNDPETYRAVLEADKKSLAVFGGHGNAIAQVYNHIIMPLANDHDKETQIIWGIKDFERRFSRAPEGMWLAETAADVQTLAILAANGIKFTILAPGQCKKTRKIGDKAWQSENGAKVDPKKPYLCNLPNGKEITLFFYDGPISQSIAFGGTLNSGEQFANRLFGAFDNRKEEQLVHIATDGETYGHHQRFSEMALAYCINYIEKNKLAAVTNYGQYLEMFSPKYEAVINENTSWSCCHGVERWRADCGCNSGGNYKWNQKWRGPLRNALNFLRDKLLETFETKGPDYFYDIWAARNAYIDVVLDRSQAARFIDQYGTEKAKQDMPAAFKLMQMQLNALFMYTSCGWFFDEISGLETVQIMAYAKRALGYNKALTGAELEPQFIKKLEAAPSNIPDFENGAKVYRQLVKPVSVGLRKVAINYAVSYLLDEILFEDHIYSYKISDQKVDVIRKEHAKLVTGYATFTSRLTTEARKVSFALLHSGGADITAGAMYGISGELDEIRDIFADNNIKALREKILNAFTETADMPSLLKEKQKQILAKSISNAHERVKSHFVNIFKQESSFFAYFRKVNFAMPPLILNVAEVVLNAELKEEVLKDVLEEKKINDIKANLKSIGAGIYEEMIKHLLSKKLAVLVSDYADDTANLEKAAKINAMLSAVENAALPVDMYKPGNIIFHTTENMPQELKNNDVIKTLCGKLNLNLTE